MQSICSKTRLDTSKEISSTPGEVHLHANATTTFSQPGADGGSHISRRTPGGSSFRDSESSKALTREYVVHPRKISWYPPVAVRLRETRRLRIGNASAARQQKKGDAAHDTLVISDSAFISSIEFSPNTTSSDRNTFRHQTMLPRMLIVLRALSWTRSITRRGSSTRICSTYSTVPELSTALISSKPSSVPTKEVCERSLRSCDSAGRLTVSLPKRISKCLRSSDRIEICQSRKKAVSS